MDWRDPSRWVRWSERTIDGEKFSFQHLLPFDMRLVRPPYGNLAAMDVGIRVVFDCHVVTRQDREVTPKDVERNTAYWMDTGNRCRRFDPQRYHHSLTLPLLVRGLVTGKTKCYVAKRANYMVWTPLTADLARPHYQAYFDLYRTRDPTPRLILYVQSAYQKDVPSKVQREHARPFATICAQLVGLIGVRKR